jgi:KipI family sensor histidine kinase inhibitor
MRITTLGDGAWLLTLADEIGEAALTRVRALAVALRGAELPACREVVPAFTSVAVVGEPGVDLGALREGIEAVVATAHHAVVPPGRCWEIPVCYGGEAGPDLAEVARCTGLSEVEVKRLHAAGNYRVHAVGFSPGFPYLAGLEPRLQVPRRATPRTRVPAGSVAIGGAQTGIYPSAGPGGWQLLGRTNWQLFHPTRRPPARLQVGDQVKFVPVDVLPSSGGGSAAADDAGPSSQGGVAVVSPGVLTTLQDAGRAGWRDQGVGPGGAVDGVALAVANLVVGNRADAAALEWTWRGPILHWRREAWVALAGCGAAGYPLGRPWRVRAGDSLDLREPARPGARGYLAVAGGWQVPAVLGSAATDLRGGFGGHAGRALRAGDRLTWSEVAREPRPGWSVSPRLLGESTAGVNTLRLVRGAQAAEFGAEGWQRLTTSEFVIRSDSDRMGTRLHGPTLTRLTTGDLISAPILPGAIQVPAGGQAIVLMAEAQTLGGYPVIAHVITADQGRLAQLRPGDRVRWVEVSIEEAQAARLTQVKNLARLAWGCAQAWRRV